jgi:hypothetical protein
MRSDKSWPNLTISKQRKNQQYQILRDYTEAVLSNAQYERKLRYWDFRKYLKREDWMAIDYLVYRREMDGKASDIVFDGALIPPKKVRKERSRNGQASASMDYARRESPLALGREQTNRNLVVCTSIEVTLC